ncbi:restriction endonuclease [Paeniglutamicibacter terrestris]|uniref:Restriction endonuclease n=1 Tax=Paeniglutamicibacter terrestris TaxID=2723403 RepID=A0ABX1G2A0_9MICC|nr:restriction endonuclease [Paeniglutamicibacter terrestris]NKG19891.1 restriction endonuclease [Paeniglutamicibacter terrestris]
MMGDLTLISDGREGLKRALADKVSEEDYKAIPGWAGVLLRFRDEIQPGDVIVAPYKPNSTINIGVVSGNYEYVASEPTHRHRRRVKWKKVGLSRTVFTQPALYEIGSALTMFRVRNHDHEFLAALSTRAESVEEVTQVVEEVAAKNAVYEESTAEPRASRIERHTRDFVLEALQEKISHRQFEEFTADLLRALGYQARVTQYSQDGGVDVIAHRDPLGVEPPLIKVQCKHTSGTIGAPDVQQLSGTQGPGDLALFVTLGAYSREALALERQRPGIRLLTGEDIVSLVLEHYARLPERWRALIPLTTLWVVADSAF